MSRGPLNIKARIEKQEKKILQLTNELESAKDEYQKLIEEKEEEDRKELFEAFKKSRSVGRRILSGNDDILLSGTGRSNTTRSER